MTMAKKTKILFYGGFSGGGTERIVFLLASLIAEIPGYDIYVLNNGKHDKTFFLSNKVTYCYLSNSYCKNIPLYNQILGVRNFIKNFDIDIIISVEAMVGIVLIPATIGLKRKIIVWEHANYYQTQGSKWTKFIRKIWLNYASAYVVLTKRDKNFFENHENPKCPLIQIYNPINLPQKVNYDINAKTILSAGHLHSIKRFHLIPRIFAPIVKKYPEWKWIIFGEGPERANIENEIKKFGLSNNIFLPGVSKEIEKEYQKAALYVLTSSQEGLPTVLLEAKSFGIPSISFDIDTGPDEIIDNHLTGELIENNNISKMTLAIEDLISNPNKRLYYSRNSLNAIKKDTNRSIVIDWTKLFGSLSHEISIF